MFDPYVAQRQDLPGPHPLDPIMATMGLCPTCEAHFRKTFLAGALAERDEARKAFDDAYSSLGQAVAERDEAREDRDNATHALARIWDIFPPTSDADNGDDDISYEPLIRRARMAADKLTAARAEVRGLHATLDQVITERAKDGLEEARLRKGWGDLIQFVQAIDRTLDQAGLDQNDNTVLRVKQLIDVRDAFASRLKQVSAERDEALEKLAKDAVARDNALAARLERTNLASR